MVNEYGYIEESYLEVERLIGQEHYSDSRRLLEEMLMAEPAYGRAHNRLGWLYHTKLQDYSKAAEHYRYAIKFDPEFPGTYVNYVRLLNEINDRKALVEVAKMGLKVPGVQKDILYTELGLSAEKSMKFAEASTYYRSSIRYTLDQHMVLRNKEHLKRLKEKRKYSVRALLSFKRI